MEISKKNKKKDKGDLIMNGIKKFIKDSFEFVYKYRFIIALVLLLLLVSLQLSGSSLGIYSDIIQGEYKQKDFTPLIGKYRNIRSDEWVVNTPIALSQDNNNYEEYNDYLRATDTDVFSMMNSPVKSIFSIGKLFNIGYFFGSSVGLSFWWYGRLIALMVVSFELFMIITNKKKLISMVGMLLITFSGATQWWYSNYFVDLMIWMQLALILLDRFMITKKYIIKVLCAIGIVISAISYVFVFYPAWQIPLAYIMLAIAIWIIIKNKNQYKINIKDIILMVIVVLLIGVFCGGYYIQFKDTLDLILNTDYPGERFELGGGALGNIYSYVYNWILPYKTIPNPCEVASMISFFPIPIIISLIYLFRNKKGKSFLIPMLIVTALLSIFAIFKTNKIFSQVTLLYLTTAKRIIVPVGVTQIYLLIYLMGNVLNKDKIMKKEVNFVVSFILSVVAMVIVAKTSPQDLMGTVLSYISGIITFVGYYLLMNMNEEKSRNYLIVCFSGLAIITGLAVNPVQRGVRVFFDKPLSKEIQTIVKDDSANNTWITESTPFFIPNYVMVNGAKVINSTNINPNFELYQKVLGEESKNEEVRKIYNRYNHLTIELTENENKVELIYQDSIRLKITPDKLKEIGVKYIVTSRDLDIYNTSEILFNKIYDEMSFYIYKIEYK